MLTLSVRGWVLRSGCSIGFDKEGHGNVVVGFVVIRRSTTDFGSRHHWAGQPVTEPSEFVQGVCDRWTRLGPRSLSTIGQPSSLFDICVIGRVVVISHSLVDRRTAPLGHETGEQVGCHSYTLLSSERAGVSCGRGEVRAREREDRAVQRSATHLRRSRLLSCVFKMGKKDDLEPAHVTRRHADALVRP